MLEINKIYNMDCLEGMKLMDPESVDLVNTDPPYNVGKDFGIYKDNLVESEYWDWYISVFKEVYRVLRNGYLYVSCASPQIFKVKDLLEKIGFKYVQYLIWYHPNMVGGTKMIFLSWNLLQEPILMLKKGPRIPMLNEVRGYLTHDVLIHTSPQSNYSNDLKRCHIAQKPISLYVHLLSRTPGKIVLDPFMGSGTTAISCKRLNRDFIGFEIEPDSVKLANKKLKCEIPDKKLSDFVEISPPENQGGF